MTTGKVDRNGATTIARMNFSGNVGHATIFSSVLSTACCLVVGLGLGLDLVSGLIVVMHLYMYTGWPKKVSHYQ